MDRPVHMCASPSLTPLLRHQHTPHTATLCLACSFRLLNVRQSYQFALVTNRTGTPTILATSPVLTNLVPNEPTQLHLVPGSVQTE